MIELTLLVNEKEAAKLEKVLEPYPQHDGLDALRRRLASLNITFARYKLHERRKPTDPERI